MTTELLNTAAAIGTFFVIAATAVTATVQLRHLRASNQLDAVLSLERDFRSPELQDSFRFVQRELDTKMQDAGFREELSALGFVDADRHREMNVCNWFNQMGTLFKHGLVEEDALLEEFSRMIGRYWEMLSPTIALLRRRRGPGQYQNFEYLAVRAQQWQKKHPEGTFPKKTPRMPIFDPWL